MFFTICLGLGYPALQRYDPRHAEGMSDTWKYYWMTIGVNTDQVKPLFRARVLVPGVARPFFLIGRKFLPAERAAFFGLLIANALFCASTACLILVIGLKVLGDLHPSLLGATLYLLSFAISNFQLSGLIDSGEACFLAALVLTLLTEKFFLLPLWAVLGALAKETFVPFATVFALVWWFTQWREGRQTLAPLKWIVLLTLMGLATVSTVHSLQAAQLRLPWQIAGLAHAPGNYVAALVRCVTERSFWYVFVWLLPLGVWRLKHFPKPWLLASLAASLVALVLASYNNSGGTVARSIFNIAGPLLSLSVALLISRVSERPRPVVTSN